MALGGAATGLGGSLMYKKWQSPIATMAPKDDMRQAYKDFSPKNDYPDLSKHNNCLANWLSKGMYDKLRDKVR